MGRKNGTLLLYPHGLGDCILATSVLKSYKAARDVRVGFVMLQRFKSSQMLERCPYIDELYFCADAWNDFESAEEGFASVQREFRKVARDEGYVRFEFLHTRRGHKIRSACEQLGIQPVHPHTEIFTSEEDVEAAREWIPDKPFGFVQSLTGVPSKDLPEGYGRKWLAKHRGLDRVVEVGVDFAYDEININVQFEIMRAASAVCVPDSVFYHACGAMDKDVDHVYFSRGESVYQRVRPLHPTRQNIVYELEQFQIN